MKRSFGLKLIVIAAIIALSAILLCACSAPPELPAVTDAEYESVYEKNGATITVDSDIKILQITDVHLFSAENKKDAKKLAELDKLLETRYDLVMVTGDLVDGYNNKSYYNKGAALDAFAEVFEKRSQFWCFVAGNNDGEYCGDNRSVIYRLSKFEHCLVADTRDLAGDGNYTVDFENQSGQTVHRVIVTDTGHRDAEGKYGSVEASQVEWYKSVAATAAAEGVKTSTFLHRPFTEINSVMKNGEAAAGYNNATGLTNIDDTAGYACLCEAILASPVNGLIATGHLHINDCAHFYKGVYWLQVGSMDSYNFKSDKRGGAVITINTDAAEIKDTYSFVNAVI